MTPQRLSKQQALTVVRDLANASRGVVAVGHAKQRLQQRKISMRQILICLRKGVITEGPALNIRGNWQVNVTRTAAGEEVTCVVAIEWDRRLVVISAF